MKLRTVLASLAAVAMLTACEDLFEDGSMQPDGSKPNLTVKNPTKAQSLTQGNGLRVMVTAVDKDKVKELQVKVRDVGGDADLVNFTTLSDKKVFELDTLLTVPGIKPGDYTLTINAIDYRTNVASEEVSFKVK
jgi:hypothetical protein